MAIVKWLAVGIAVLVLLAVVAGRLGLLQGKAPGNLGVREGRLKPPAKTPNSVSSQALLYADHPMRDAAQIAPLPLRGDGPATLAQLKVIIEAQPGANVIQSTPDYLYAQFTTPLMKYVDDVEFWFDPAAGVVQVRSASRVGHGDQGLNRARIEAIRTLLAAAP